MPKYVPHILWHSVLKLQRLKATHQREIFPPKKPQENVLRLFPCLSRGSPVFEILPAHAEVRSHVSVHQRRCGSLNGCRSFVLWPRDVSSPSSPSSAVPTGLSDWRWPVQEMPNLWDTLRFFFARASWLRSWHPIGWERIEGWWQGFFMTCLKEMLSLGRYKHLFLYFCTGANNTLSSGNSANGRPYCRESLS